MDKSLRYVIVQDIFVFGLLLIIGKLTFPKCETYSSQWWGQVVISAIIAFLLFELFDFIVKAIKSKL
jgi:hypothetical protein